MANGAVMAWSSWYVRAAVDLGSDEAVGLLLETFYKSRSMRRMLRRPVAVGATSHARS